MAWPADDTESSRLVLESIPPSAPPHVRRSLKALTVAAVAAGVLVMLLIGKSLSDNLYEVVYKRDEVSDVVPASFVLKAPTPHAPRPAYYGIHPLKSAL